MGRLLRKITRYCPRSRVVISSSTIVPWGSNRRKIALPPAVSYNSADCTSRSVSAGKKLTVSFTFVCGISTLRKVSAGSEELDSSWMPRLTSSVFFAPELAQPTKHTAASVKHPAFLRVCMAGHSMVASATLQQNHDSRSTIPQGGGGRGFYGERAADQRRS